jgi:poly-gamma-glutamate synthesis protein (capsule biosynthesis protein)
MFDEILPMLGAGNVVVASIHWESNWGYRIPPEQRDFALSISLFLPHPKL